MSGNYNNGIPPHSEYPNLENESVPFNYDWAVAGYPQPCPFDFAVNTETIFGNDSLQTNTTSRVNPKVAIPRTAQPSSWTSSGRVSRACENCREQKAKCSGHRPVCHRCQESGVPCSYGDRKREKMAKQLNDLTARVEIFNALLLDLYPKLDASSAQKVDQTLGELNSRASLIQVNLPTPALSNNPSRHITQSSILSSSADAGPVVAPVGAIDYTDEDFSRDEKVRAMGFVGEHSEMAWLYRLKRDLDHENFNLTKEIPEPSSISSVNYFQDDSEILVLDDLDLARRPPQHIANILVESYFSLVHPTFPIIGKSVFLNQYRSFYTNPNVRPGKRWIAVLNLVFAIANRHSLLVIQPQPDCDDHQTYFARAWMLSVRNVLLDHPDLQQTQVEGLAAFYLLSVGQVNRSWRILGIAIRSAVTMGLNIRSISGSITHHSKELRYRVWWALSVLDMGLCEMTGRPPSMEKIFCTTPLPVPFAEEAFRDERVVQLITNQENRTAFFASLLYNSSTVSSKEGMALNHSGQQGSGKGKQENTNQPGTEDLTPNASQYFLYTVDLAHLLREAINILYAPGAMRLSWPEIENDISMLNNHADNWLARLPAEFHFTTLEPTRQFIQQCVSLAFRFYATKLIILQHCMRRSPQLRSETTPPGSMCYQMAAICLRTAVQMLDMLAEEPDLTWLYGVAPWWCILHNIMQSITILLTELFTHTPLGTVKAADLSKQINKANRWLKEMSAKDPCSQRAWLVCMEIISQHGAKFGFDVDALF